MIGISVGSLLIASATIRNAERNGMLIAEPSDGLSFDAIIMLPELVEQDVDPEVIVCLERLIEVATD
jgi:hypothetical protein